VGVKELLAGENEENILMLPHDVVTVPVAEAVLSWARSKTREVLSRCASISVRRPWRAPGIGADSAPPGARIVRIIPAPRTEEIPVDLKVLAGTTEDVSMRPNDILVVPPAGQRLWPTEAAIQTTTGS
jgi:hypothetical protein